MATAKERIILELKAQGTKQTAEELSRTADRVLEVQEQTRRLNSELNKLIPTQGRHNKLIRNSNGNYKDAAQGMRMMRGGAAQLGYQIQDVAVQYQMGTNAMMIFAQQGSQIASLFGAGGAGLGALIAIGGALASVALNSKVAKKDTSELADEIMGLGKAYNELTQAQQEFLRAKHAEEILAMQDEITALQDELVKLADYEQALSDLEILAQGGVNADAYAQAMITASDVTERLTESTADHEARIQTLRDRIGLLTGEFSNYTNNMEGNAAAHQTMIDNLLAEVAAIDARKKARQDEFGLFLDSFNAEIAAMEQRKQARQEEFGVFLDNFASEIAAIDARTAAEKKAAEEKIATEQMLYDVFKGFDEKRAEDEQAALDRFFDNFAEETRMMEERNARIKQLNDGALQSYGSMFGGIGEMMKDGSRAQQAAFAVQKGIAVAQAVMNLHKAVSEANTLPFPANFAAIAQAVATGTAAIAGVKSASFEGGGYTGMGARSGGIDGKGGFPAILHPNETIIDHTKGQSDRPVTVNFNITANDTSGFDQLLQSRRGQIIGIINQAVNNRGRPSVA